MRKRVKLIFSRYIMRITFITFITCMMLFYFPGILMGQGDKDVEIKASISADKIGTDDVLIYTVTFKGINNPMQPNVSHFKDFQVGQTSRSTEFRFVNGVSSYYTNFTFYLIPLKTGHLTLPPVTYEYEGSEYKTQPFTVEVVKGSIAPSQPKSRPVTPRSWPFDSDDDFFSSPFRRQQQPQEIDVKLVPEVSAKNTTVGQQIIFKVYIYTRNSIRGFNLVSNLSIPGFWQEMYPAPKSFDIQKKIINGKEYTTAEILKVALFPTHPGNITIPSLKFELGIEDVNSFSILSTTRNISRSTPELTVNVSQLPPEAMGLPVGNFQLEVIPNKKEVDINDILTLKIRISGKGNVKTLNVPEFTNSDYFKVYPSKISRDFSYNTNDLSGVVEAEVPVAFKKTGLISFPTLEFRYYDPEASRVVTFKNQPLMINVTGVKEKVDSAVSLPESEIIKTGEDIDFIKKGEVYDQDKNIYKNSYFRILLLVPFLLNLLLLFKVLVFDRFISQSTLLKQKKLFNQTLKKLKNAREYGDVSPILENYLKGKTGLGLSEINNQTIGQLLGQYGVDNSDINAFIEVKSQSESSRFSQDKTAFLYGRDLKEDVKQLVEILKRIDSKIK